MSESVIIENEVADARALPLDHTVLRRPAFHLDAVGVVAEVGRSVLIAFVLFVLYGSVRAMSNEAIVAIAVATFVWEGAFHATRTSARLLIGPVGAFGFATALGLGGVAALNGSAVGLHVSSQALAADALAVFGSGLAWEAAVAFTSAGERRVLLVGTETEVPTEDELRHAGPQGYRLVGAVAASEELGEVVERLRPDVVVLMDDSGYDAAIERIMDARANVRVATFPTFCDYALGRIPVDRIRPVWFMSLFHPRQHVYAGRTKRAFDIVTAVVALTMAAPVIATLALLAKVTTGHTFFRQTRIGEGGKPFTIYKFPSMCADAEVAGATFAQKDDPRVTRLGRVLRRTHLDELPQLWNVLKGDMSIVGPRPERPEFISMIEAEVPFWSRRLLVKPGVTGWAQVCCDYASDCEAMEEKLAYDLWYLRHRSMLVDAAVCVRTVGLQLRCLMPTRRRNEAGA
ncbi:MAG: sugar transferase [Gaiellaceae bacterium]